MTSQPPSADTALFEHITRNLYTAVLSDALDEVGVRDRAMREHLRPLEPNTVVAGRARTVLCMDLYHIQAAPYAREIEAVDSILPGEVVVVATGESKRNAPWGELLSTAAKARGARGAIIDGLIRDVQKILSLGFPVFAAGSESRSRLFGGNSNWRGSIWFPLNFLIIESLQKFHHYYGDDSTIECPTGSGVFMTIDQVAAELAKRLTRIFLKNREGKRQVNALYPRFQNDEHFRDYVPFYEYFDGDTARGVGASHQTGWTGIVAKMLLPRAGYQLPRS